MLTVFLLALTAFVSISAHAASSVTLAWDPSVSPNVTGYNLYYGAISRTYTNVVSAGSATSATVSGLAPNTIYYFAVTAFDSNGIESDFSIETNYFSTPPSNYPPTLDPISNITINESAGQQTISLTGITTGATNEFQNISVMAISGNTGLIPNPSVTYSSPNTSGTLRFSPVALSNGTATITVILNDGQAQYGTFTRSFTVTVVPVNQAPTLNAIADITVNENSGQQSVSLSGISSGAPNEKQTLTVRATSGSPSIIPNPTATYTSPNATGTLRFTPVANASGTALISVTVDDGQPANNLITQTFTVTVGASRPPPSNTPPVISAISSQTTTQNVAIAAIPFTIGDQESSASSLTLSASSSSPTLIPTANIVFGGSGSNRTVTITPAANKSGNANITITVNDGSKTASATFSVSVLSDADHQLVLSQEGQGTVSGIKGSTIVSGHTYKLTAKPAAGQEFAGWTGSMNSDSPTISFTGNSNIVLHAKFVLSPFIPIMGTYNGLFNEDAQVNQNSSGSFSVTVSSHGNYSGKIQLGASKLSFTGKLNLLCTATNTVTRKLAAPLTVHLRVGTNAEIDQIFGQVVDNSWTATMTGDRARFSSKTNPAPYVGSYTMIIPGQPGDSSKPAGHSYGAFKVATSGVTTFAGVLADGTKVTQSAAISKNGEWPFYASLYVGQGSLLSWFTFANHASDDVSGAISWIKLPVATAKYYPGGFTTEAMASGSTYVKPVSTSELIINVPNAVVDFSGGNLSPDFSNSISLGLSSKVTNLSSNKLTMAFTTGTGLYKGSVVDPATGATLPFAGAVFQKVDLGYGSLMGASQSSSVVVSP